MGRRQPAKSSVKLLSKQQSKKRSKAKQPAPPSLRQQPWGGLNSGGRQAVACRHPSQVGTGLPAGVHGDRLEKAACFVGCWPPTSQGCELGQFLGGTEPFSMQEAVS